MAEYVDKLDAFLALVEAGQTSKRYKIGEVWHLNGEEIRRALDGVPTADVRPFIQGEWMDGLDGDLDPWCLNCGGKMPYTKYGSEWESPYCPSCGAYMVEQEEDK